MRRFSLDTVIDCEKIFQQGDTVIFSGKHPWIFRKDGTYIGKIKSISRAYEMLFLPNNTVFMDGCGDRSYHYVSLDTGEVLWCLPQKGRRYLAPQKMAVSPDGTTVYYLYCVGSSFGNLYIDKIVPEERLCTTKKAPPIKGAVCGFFCDKSGDLCILYSVACSHDIRLYKLNPATLEIVSCDEFTYVSQGGWKMAGDDQYIIFDDWNVYALRTGETFSLMEHEPQTVQRNPFVIDGYDPDRKLLTVHYLDHGSTVILDCEKHKIAAHYRPISSGLHGGCLLDNEFWIGSYEGIVKRPFPHMDPFPRKFFADSNQA